MISGPCAETINAAHKLFKELSERLKYQPSPPDADVEARSVVLHCQFRKYSDLPYVLSSREAHDNLFN